MLGEDHSLASDFPELKDTINNLIKSDPSFAAENKQYTALDKEIRKLEMNNAPIDDDEMTRLKHKRALFKDDLYAKITEHSPS